MNNNINKFALQYNKFGNRIDLSRKSFGSGVGFGTYNSGGDITNPLWDSLYAVYKAENNADDSLGVYNGTAVGGLTYGTGVDGNDFVTNGTNSYINLPDNSFNFSGDFTISVWINTISLGGNRTIFSNYTYSGGLNYGYQFYFNNSGLVFGIYDGATLSPVSFAGTFSTGTWRNFIVSREYGVGTKLYVNGVLNNSDASTVNPGYTTTHRPCVGATKYDATNVTYFLNSNIDEMYFWDRLLSDSEKTELYNSGAGTFYE